MKYTKYPWQKEFVSPTSAYRAKPFWAWNGKLEEPELRRQIRLMGQMGFGGFFMHSRTGLATPYLSKEWFDLTGACVDEAARQKMEAWLYDEDRFPSGAAGGLVTCKPEFQMKYLEMTIGKHGLNRQDKSALAVFAAEIKSGRIAGMERLRSGRAGSVSGGKGNQALVFRVKAQPAHEWFNGQTYLDVLNPKAVKAFIDVTHEGYRKHVGGQFGKTIPGVFTDEPSYALIFRPKEYAIPWTDALPAVFKRRYGYDLLDYLPELYLLPADIEFSRVRYHFVDCITWLLTESFSRQIGEWCGRNRLLFTGHVLFEDTLSTQTAWVGSAMRFYEHMQAPGMDLLTEQWRIYDVPKQVSSAARQFGRKWRLSETDGCTGWDFSFAGHKALGDWQAALGINVRCPHLSWYTMEGEAKRDFPASISYQSPWWQDYRVVEDYFARIHTIMTRGEEVRDLLVIHPVESLWGSFNLSKADYVSDPASDHAHLDRQIQAIRDSLLRNHLDFDYGDEEIISRLGRVRGGAVPNFFVGKADYKAVLVPPLITIRSSTLALLRRFQAAGGLVVFLGAAPKYVDAVPSSAAIDVFRKCTVVPNRASAFIPVLESACRRISLADGQGQEIPSVLYLLRTDKEASYLFACNTGHSLKQLGRPMLKDVLVAQRQTAIDRAFIRGFGDCEGTPIELDPASGEMRTAKAVRKNGAWELQTSFPALGSRLFVIPKRKSRLSLPAHVEWKTSKCVRMTKAHWSVSLSEPNVLVLDRPCFKIGKDAWRGADEILKVDSAVRDALGIKRRGFHSIQPWAQTEKAAGREEVVELKYKFNVGVLPGGELSLAIEHPDVYAIHINGVSLNGDMASGWWVDRSLRKMPLPSSMLKIGENEIVLATRYTARHPGFEAVYLLGAFGVRLRKDIGLLTAAPQRLKLGDWSRQGLPFYSGSVGYLGRIRAAARAGQRVMLHVPAYAGTAVKVWVDGRDAGCAAWPPYQIDITSMLDSDNRWHDMRVEVLGHRRNSHGPLHYAVKHPAWTGPGEYIAEGKLWSDAYTLVPCGLLKPPEILTLRRLP